jgi:hypothetical protein
VLHRHLFLRFATVAFAFLVVLSLPACLNRSRSTSSSVAWFPQAQNPPKPPRPELPLPDNDMTGASNLFKLGREGEERYKGKVVAIYGKVNVDAMHPAAPGGTTTALIENEEGGPPYAQITLGEYSNELLFGEHNLWHPITSVGFNGFYMGRDERGTILLDRAVVTFVGRPNPDTPASPSPKNEVARKDPPKDRRDPVDGGRKDGGRKDGGAKDGGKKPEAPIVITPDRLAQELVNDIVKNYPRYYGKPLQLTGVVHKRVEDKGEIVHIDFLAKVKDPKSGKADEWTVFCGLKPHVKTSDPAAAALAEGKTVTIRGQLSAGGNGQATLFECEVVRE